MSVGLFIDGAYVSKTFKDYMDYKKLRDHVEAWTTDTIDEGYYFDSIAGDGRTDKFLTALSVPAPRGPVLRVKTYPLQTNLISWPLALGGKPVVHPDNPSISYEQTTQKSVDVGLVFHMMRSYRIRNWTKLVLAAGDADFYEPVQYLVEQENVDLYLVGSLRNISERLRPYAREILEIDQYPLHNNLQLARCIERSSSSSATRAIPSFVQ